MHADLRVCAAAAAVEVARVCAIHHVEAIERVLAGVAVHLKKGAVDAGRVALGCVPQACDGAATRNGVSGEAAATHHVQKHRQLVLVGLVHEIL